MENSKFFSLNTRSDLDERFEEMMDINAHSLWILVYIVSNYTQYIHDHILPTGGSFEVCETRSKNRWLDGPQRPAATAEVDLDVSLSLRLGDSHHRTPLLVVWEP